MAGILSAPRETGRGERLLLAALAAVWLLFALPLLSGERTLLLRDVFTTHLPQKAYGAAALAHGSIPAFHPAWAGGQPFAGNPNFLAFYPGNLLYLVLPFWSAFNAHYVLHWLLAFVGFRKFAREVGQSPLAATFAALTYAASGYVLSCLTFYNLIAVAAWLPFVLWGLARGGRRGTLWGGLACGGMLLAGEPVTAALAVALMALIAVERRGFLRGLGATFAVGGLGLAVALPQVVATARTFAFTYRGAHGLEAGQAANHALHPLRLLELVLPLPWGWPAELGRFGYWSEVTPLTPYIYSLHFGVVALALALYGVRFHRRWAALVGASLLLGIAGGLSGELLLALSGGLFRYPQKLLIWTTIGAALLAGWGLDRRLATGGVPGERQRAVGGLGLGAGVAALAAIVLIVLRRPVQELFRERLGARHELVAATQQAQWLLACLAAAALLAAAAWALRRRRGEVLIALQAIALLQLLPTVATDRVEAHAPAAPWVERLGGERSVALASNAFPPWSERTPARPFETVAAGWRDARLDLEPASGALHGLAYPVAPDLDGIYSPLQALLNDNLARFDWPARLRWLRLLGAGWLVRLDDGRPAPPLELVAWEHRAGVRSELYRIPDPAPFAFWPREVLAVASPIAALGATTNLADPLAVAFASRAVEHHAGASVELLAAEDDRLRLVVEGQGGLLVVQRCYFPLVEARLADGRRLATQPVDLVLLGVEVPAGRHEIQIGSSSRPEAIAGGLSLLTLFVAAFAGWRWP